MTAASFRSAVGCLILMSVVAGCSLTPLTGEQPLSTDFPPGFPEDFPVPAGAELSHGATDHLEHTSSVTLVVPGDMVGAVQFFQIGLVDAGFVVTQSGGTDATWTMEFFRGETDGRLDMAQGAGVVTVVAEVNGV